MAGPAPRLPMDLGRLVRHQHDDSEAVGLIVGLVFEPSTLALVRWRRGGSTFEMLDHLIEVPGLGRT
jgi:hypothetical protein